MSDDKFKLKSNGTPLESIDGIPSYVTRALYKRGFFTVEQVYGAILAAPEAMFEFASENEFSFPALKAKCEEIVGDNPGYKELMELPCPIQEDLDGLV